MAILIRDFNQKDIAPLRKVFYSSVHQLASPYYTKSQINGWAPDFQDKNWEQKIIRLHPFVAELDGETAGYADLQKTGLIDHFFVDAQFARRGVGTALMNHIHKQAHKRKIKQLYAFVSLAAEDFFASFGFKVEKRQSLVINNETLRNALMRKLL